MAITFDELFALRLSCLDDNIDEYEIINILRDDLLRKTSMTDNEILQHIKDFYEYFNSNMTIEQINDALNINQLPELIQPIIIPLQGISYNEMSNNMFQDLMLLMLGAHPDIAHQNAPQEDIVSTLDENEETKLNKYILSEDCEDKCSICMCSMDKEEEVCKLPCDHLYHNECIDSWLKNYNYKCPICRNEVGKPKHNI